jgi:hypothetical protein
MGWKTSFNFSFLYILAGNQFEGCEEGNGIAKLSEEFVLFRFGLE